jgi:hypothetical protein
MNDGRGRRSSPSLKGKRYRLARQRTLELHQARTGQPWSDRFIVTSVTGYPIPTNGSTGQTSGKPTTIWYVLDSAYCDVAVAEFPSSREDNGALRARRHARVLNMRDWQESRE